MTEPEHDRTRTRQNQNMSEPKQNQNMTEPEQNQNMTEPEHDRTRACQNQSGQNRVVTACLCRRGEDSDVLQPRLQRRLPDRHVRRPGGPNAVLRQLPQGACACAGACGFIPIIIISIYFYYRLFFVYVYRIQKFVVQKIQNKNYII